MYLLFFILCDASLILAAGDQLIEYIHDPSEFELRQPFDVELLANPANRVRRNTNTTTTSYHETASISVSKHPDNQTAEGGAPKLNTNIVLNVDGSQSSATPKKINAYMTSSTNLSPENSNFSKKGTVAGQDAVIVPQTTGPNSDLYNQAVSYFVHENETLKLHNISKQTEDYHVYYNSTRTQDAETGQHYWVDFTNRSDAQTHLMLSRSHRRAVTVPLPFKFQFYGHEIENVTIATGGFLYTGDYIHSWLAATQYIAPLMANFDTRLLNDSFIKYVHNDTTFTVLWENVSLQDRPLDGNFTFEATLCKNGDIIFVYKNIPNITKEITEDHHPVKVGLSDAYIMDRTIFFVRRKTIFEYHRVHIDKKDLKNWTVIYFKPLTTCLNKTTCESCLAKDTSFDCQWCDGRCSDGVDRKKHEWVKKDCDKRKINETKFCNLVNEKVPTPGAHKAMDYNEGAPQNGRSSSSIVFLVILALGSVFSIFLWTMYAYRHPHSTSGQMLIRYRPSQWNSLRKGEARYTAATIHM